MTEGNRTGKTGKEDGHARKGTGRDEGNKRKKSKDAEKIGQARVKEVKRKRKKGQEMPGGRKRRQTRT